MFANLFDQVIRRASTEYNSWKQVFSNTRNAKVNFNSIEIPFLYDMEPVSGQFEYFIYPTRYFISFEGWNPVVIPEDTFTIVIGLPSRPMHDIIVTCISEYDMDPRQIVVLAETNPNWQQILDSLTDVYPKE